MGHGLNYDKSSNNRYIPTCDSHNSTIILANVATAMLSGVYENLPRIEAELAQRRAEVLEQSRLMSENDDLAEDNIMEDDSDDEEIIVDDETDLYLPQPSSPAPLQSPPPVPPRLDSPLKIDSTTEHTDNDKSPEKKTHGGDKKLYHCQHCKYLTDRKNNLKRHVVTMHEKCGKVLECCEIVFANKSALREHVVAFHRSGYDCRICGRTFCRKALLKRHVTVHSGQKDYVCVVCGYATSHKSNLDRHKRRHSAKYEGTLMPDVHPNPSNTAMPSPPVRVPYEDCYPRVHDALRSPVTRPTVHYDSPHMRPERSIAPTIPAPAMSAPAISAALPLSRFVLTPPYGTTLPYAMLTEATLHRPDLRPDLRPELRPDLMRYYGNTPLNLSLSSPHGHGLRPSADLAGLHPDIAERLKYAYSMKPPSMRPFSPIHQTSPTGGTKRKPQSKTHSPSGSAPRRMSPLHHAMVDRPLLPLFDRPRLVPGGLYPCAHCSEVFTRQIQLEEHVKSMCWLKATNKSVPQRPLTIAVRNEMPVEMNLTKTAKVSQ